MFLWCWQFPCLCRYNIGDINDNSKYSILESSLDVSIAPDGTTSELNTEVHWFVTRRSSKRCPDKGGCLPNNECNFLHSISSSSRFDLSLRPSAVSSAAATIFVEYRQSHLCAGDKGLISITTAWILLGAECASSCAILTSRSDEYHLDIFENLAQSGLLKLWFIPSRQTSSKARNVNWKIPNESVENIYLPRDCFIDFSSVKTKFSAHSVYRDAYFDSEDIKGRDKVLRNLKLFRFRAGFSKIPCRHEENRSRFDSPEHSVWVNQRERESFEITWDRFR